MPGREASVISHCFGLSSSLLASALNSCSLRTLFQFILFLVIHPVSCTIMPMVLVFSYLVHSHYLAKVTHASFLCRPVCFALRSLHTDPWPVTLAFRCSHTYPWPVYFALRSLLSSLFRIVQFAHWSLSCRVSRCAVRAFILCQSVSHCVFRALILDQSVSHSAVIVDCSAHCRYDDRLWLVNVCKYFLFSVWTGTVQCSLVYTYNVLAWLPHTSITTIRQDQMRQEFIYP